MSVILALVLPMIPLKCAEDLDITSWSASQDRVLSGWLSQFKPQIRGLGIAATLLLKGGRT